MSNIYDSKQYLHVIESIADMIDFERSTDYNEINEPVIQISLPNNLFLEITESGKEYIWKIKQALYGFKVPDSKTIAERTEFDKDFDTRVANLAWAFRTAEEK